MELKLLMAVGVIFVLLGQVSSYLVTQLASVLEIAYFKAVQGLVVPTFSFHWLMYMYFLRRNNFSINLLGAVLFAAAG
jgi:hypothetical protein